MVSPPWEPFPERKRKLEGRGKRSKNRRNRGASKRRRNPATDSSFSSSSPSGERLPTDRSGEETDDFGFFRHRRGSEGPRKDLHIRERPEDCWCLREGGCGDEDGCCVEDLKGVNMCPCLQRISVAAVPEDKLDEIDTCNVCLENGKLRNCCNRHYCRLCYEGTGNCPGCDLITIGANRGLLKQVQSGTKVPGDGAATNTTEHVQECEECRLCLRQGFTRKCCGEFFCSDCYFKTGHCPSCRSLVQTWIKSERIPRDPGNLPVLLGYLATLLVSLAVLACAAIAVANNYSFIATVFGQTCYGFFPSCSKDTKCVEFEGSASSGLEPTTAWTNCKNESTVNKVYGTYCVFDKTVFVNSREKWGFDFCADEYLASFDGVFVFEDTFELWRTRNVSLNTMASARWDHVINGNLSDICGVGAGEAALVFSGVGYREAETLDVDMSYGGKITFLFKMGPYVWDPSGVACKPAYDGNVHLYYSLDEGTEWRVLAILEAYSYRGDDFSEVEVEVPSAWNASAIRFKWKQENFQNALEFWTLDDVRIRSYFLENWHETEAFAKARDVEAKTIREIQCCLNSEQCDLSRAQQEAVDCSAYVSEVSNERALFRAERFVVLAALVALAKFVYHAVETIALGGWGCLVPVFLRKKRPKIFMAEDPVPLTMNRVFKLDVDPRRVCLTEPSVTGIFTVAEGRGKYKRWHARFLLLVGAPLVISWVYCATLVRNIFLVEELTLLPDLASATVKLKVHVLGLFLLATFMDAHAAFLLARDVVCVLPVWVPDVDVDLRPSAGWVRVGKRYISIANIKDTEMFSRRFCVWLAAGYVLGVMPFCLVALIIKYSYIPYTASRYVTATMGSVLLLRAWLGPDWVVKSAYLLRWLFTLNLYERDDIGNAFAAEKTPYLVTYCMVSGTLLTMGFMLLFNTRHFALVSGVSVIAFAVYGLGLSVAQGLPVTPNIKLTTIARGTLIRVHRRVVCPCERRLERCGDMHSRDELLCVFVRDALTFSDMLLAGHNSVG